MQTPISASNRAGAVGLFGRIYARVFRERELLLRSNGRVRFLRLTPRLQVGFALLLGAIMLWGAGGSLLSWHEFGLIEARDGRLADAQIAYDDLLEEIAIYQRKVSSVTGKLRQNQSDLVRQFAWADALEAEVLATGQAAPAKHRRLAAISEARSAMNLHLQQLQGDLRMMTDLDAVLKSSLNSMQSDLQDAADERKKGYQARAVLIAEVKQLTGTLKASDLKVSALSEHTGELEASLRQSHMNTEQVSGLRKTSEARVVELNQLLQTEGRRGTALEKWIAELRSTLAASKLDYERISGVRANLDVKVAGLEGALGAEEDRANALEADLQKFAAHLSGETGTTDSHNPAKESLSTRIASLLDRLTTMNRARSHVFESLQTRTAGSVEEAERILGMTGLSIEAMLAKVDASQTSGEGGPFIAALPNGAELAGFAGKVNAS